MIDITKSKSAFKTFLDKYEDKSDAGFKLKVVHTYHVADNARNIAEKLKLSKEDIELAELIGLLHDIGRFEELRITKELNSVKFDHASHGVKMLFEKGMIRDFIEDTQYDEIIKIAIGNHSRLAIEYDSNERTLLHSKIIRDADKLDNYRVKKDESIEAIFPTRVKSIEDMENATLSDKVFETIQNKQCVDIHDRVTALDFWACILAFTLEQLKSVMGYPLPEATEILFNKAKKEIGIEILKKSGIIMDKYLRDCNSNLLYDKVKETINMLNNKYSLFIVSNCKVGYIETFLRTQNLTEIFKDYECNGKTGLSKGQNIKLIMDRNSIKNAVYVGDTINDKEASEYAGIPFVYASYGFGKVTEYDYKLNNIEDLVKI